MEYVEKPRHDKQFVGENHEVLIAFPHNVVNVLNEKAQQTDFEHQSWQVVVQEQSTLDEKVRHEIDQIAKKECEANVLKFSPFLVAQINDLSTTP
jgi:hypothetical protein